MTDRSISAARFLAHRLREAALYPALMRHPGRPRIAFLPPDGRVMSSLLRGYDMARALRRRGWNAVVVPKQLEPAQRRRVLRLFRPDLSVLMGSRHPDNSADLLRGRAYVYDLDDADFHDPAMTARMQRDAQAANGIVAGSRYVADWCRRQNANTTVIWTGTPETPADWPGHRTRNPIVTWAQSAPFGYPAELAFVCDVALRLRSTGAAFTLRLYGCGADSAARPELAPLRDAGIALDLLPFMDYDRFLASLREAAVGLSPIIPSDAFSRGKSFGKILGYLGAGVPVVTSDEADHALFFDAETGVVTNDPAIWATRIAGLLADPDLRDRMAGKAHDAFRRRLTTEVAANRLDMFCRSVIAGIGKDRPQDRAKPA